MKQNKMSDSTKFLLLAATIIVVCVLVAAGFMMVKNGQSSVSGGVNQFNEMASDYADVNLAGYDGRVVLGSEVRSFLRKAKDEEYEFDITVTTKIGGPKGTVEYVGEDKDFKDSLDIEDIATTAENYINPHGQFLGKVHKNDNGMVKEVTFDQQ